jgi:hypothetical protein
MYLQLTAIYVSTRFLSFWGPPSQDPWGRAAIPYRQRARSGVGAPEARAAPAKARANQNPRKSNGTDPSPILPSTRMNKAGHSGVPLRSSHGRKRASGTSSIPCWGTPGRALLTPLTRGEVRVWSTKRPGTAQVDPVRIRLDFEPISAISKLTHGNSDARLGRWLHASRFSCSAGRSPHQTIGGDSFLEHTQSPPHSIALSARQS